MSSIDVKRFEDHLHYINERSKNCENSLLWMFNKVYQLLNERKNKLCIDIKNLETKQSQVLKDAINELKSNPTLYGNKSKIATYQQILDDIRNTSMEITFEKNKILQTINEFGKVMLINKTTQNSNTAVDMAAFNLKHNISGNQLRDIIHNAPTQRFPPEISPNLRTIDNFKTVQKNFAWICQINGYNPKILPPIIFDNEFGHLTQKEMVKIVLLEHEQFKEAYINMKSQLHNNPYQRNNNSNNNRNTNTNNNKSINNNRGINVIQNNMSNMDKAKLYRATYGPDDERSIYKGIHTHILIVYKLQKIE